MAKRKQAAAEETGSTRFAQESAAQSGAMVLAPSLMTQLFTTETKPLDETKLERLNLPRLLKPDQVPVWTKENPVTLQGKIHKVVWSPNSTIKGFVLWLITPGGAEITFPCTGVVRSALAPGMKIDDSNARSVEESKASLQAALEKHVGKTLFLKRTANQMNSKYKKDMFMFDVFVGKA